MLGTLLRLKADSAFDEIADEDSELLSVLDRILMAMIDSSEDSHTEVKVSITLSHHYRKQEAAEKIAERTREALKQDTSLTKYSIEHREGSPDLRVHIMWDKVHG